MDVTLPELTSALWSRRWVLAASAFSGVVLGVVVAVFLLSDYRARSTVAPLGAEAGVSGIAAAAFRLGIPIGDLSSSNLTIDFFARVLESRDLLTRLAQTEYSFRQDGEALEGTFLDFGGFTGDDPRQDLEDAVESLRNEIVPGVDISARMLTIETRAPFAALAEQINRRALTELNEITVGALRGQARAEREFLEAREVVAREELREAETAAQRFLEQNRTYTTSPQLQFEFARLERTVSLRHGVYSSVAEALERARLAEVRSTPALTVIDAPEGSARRHLPLFLTAVLVGIAFAFSAAAVVVVRVFGPEWWKEQQTATDRGVRGR